MDVNVVVFSGTIAAEPEVRRFPSGATLVRHLVTVRSNAPHRRVDVIPVTLWDPPETVEYGPPLRGRHVWVVGSIQRRFWSSESTRRSRIEVVAHTIELRKAREAGGSEAPASA